MTRLVTGFSGGMEPSYSDWSDSGPQLSRLRPLAGNTSIAAATEWAFKVLGPPTETAGTWAAPGLRFPATITGVTLRDVELTELLRSVRECAVCAPMLPLGPRPVVQAGSTARIVIIGQAPGKKVHLSGVPWDDPSGRTLRGWLGITAEEFYDPALIALVGMGFCYPGSTPSGDKPPRPECAPLWHDRILAELSRARLDVIVGSYAQKRYVPDSPGSVTATVARWADYLPTKIVLPHPSPRNRGWLTSNPWFEAETLPAVRERVRQVLANSAS
jgi:uracil-DNA glycosylase